MYGDPLRVIAKVKGTLVCRWIDGRKLLLPSSASVSPSLCRGILIQQSDCSGKGRSVWSRWNADTPSAGIFKVKLALFETLDTPNSQENREKAEAT